MLLFLIMLINNNNAFEYLMQTVHKCILNCYHLLLYLCIKLKNISQSILEVLDDSHVESVYVGFVTLSDKEEKWR